jgi:hypothetical protein
MLTPSLFKIGRPRKNGLEIRMQVVGAIDRNLSISSFESLYTYIKEVRRETFFGLNKLKKRQLNKIKKDSLAKAQDLIDRIAGNLKGWHEAMCQAAKHEESFRTNLMGHLDALLKSKELDPVDLPKQPADLSTLPVIASRQGFRKGLRSLGVQDSLRRQCRLDEEDGSVQPGRAFLQL